MLSDDKSYREKSSRVRGRRVLGAIAILCSVIKDATHEGDLVAVLLDELHQIVGGHNTLPYVDAHLDHIVDQIDAEAVSMVEDELNTVVMANFRPRISQPTASITMLNTKMKPDRGMCRKCSTTRPMPVVPQLMSSAGSRKSLMAKE